MSSAIGVIQANLIIFGKISIGANSQFDASLTGGVRYDIDNRTDIKTVDDLLSLTPTQIANLIVDATKAGDLTKIGLIINVVSAALQTILAAGVKIAYSTLAGIQKADEIIDIIEKFTSPINYTYQYNSASLFEKSLPITQGNKRRLAIEQPLYLSSALHSVNSVTYNNFGRENTVLVELNKGIDDPKTKDESRKTISEFGICDKPKSPVASTTSCFYGTSRIQNPNQYGQLGSAQIVKVSDVLYDFDTTPVLYGGDCIIARFQVQRRHKMFSQDLSDNTFPDKVEYDYRLYPNIAYPRYWTDSTKFNFAGVLNRNIVNAQRFSRTTSSKHNLDCKKKNDGDNVFRIDNSYMYTSINGVLDFFVECDYNINFREDTQYPHYNQDNTNLSQIFRADKLKFPEEFKLNRSFADLQVNEVFNQQLRLDYTKETSFPEEQSNSVIYSLPSYNLQNIDNWRYFLPNNFFNFRESDFGRLTQIHKLDQDRLLFLMSRSSPYVSMGRDFLELEQSGRKITIGDGGLFAQDPREIAPTDDNYGSTNSKYAFSNTMGGRFYPSDTQGRILSFNENIDDISMNGLSQWCHEYIPLKLKQHFPKYNKEENPINGVGYLMVSDSDYGIIYLVKRDFLPKIDYINNIECINNKFYLDGLEISLRDETYFRDVSFTLSYSYIDKGFISYHDWHPDLVQQEDKHFLTIKDKGVWKHNVRTDSFCNFYGKDYPFEVEPLVTNGLDTMTLSSLEYILEVYRYKNNGVDKVLINNENFDKLIVWNPNQCSPLYDLVLLTDLEQLPYYPKRTLQSWEILYRKIEHHYRINKFFDAVKDNESINHIWHYDESGYKKVLNPIALDLDKPEDKWQKFRAKWTRLFFSKTVSGSSKFLIKLFQNKKLNSFS